MDFQQAYGRPERPLGFDNISHRPQVKGCGSWSSGRGWHESNADGIFGDAAELDRD
jgi:hypothetical protein